MNMTEALRKWLIANCDIKEDATDDEFKKAAGQAMVDGKLLPEKYAELTKDPKEDEANEFSAKLDTLIGGLGKLTEVLTKKEEKPEEKEEIPATETKEVVVEKKEVSKMVSELGGTPTEPDEKAFNIRVKEAAERYSTETKSLLYPEKTWKDGPHPKYGQRVKEFGRYKNGPSELDMALAGAWAKYMAASVVHGVGRAYEVLPQHDKELFCYLCEKGDWDDTTVDGKLKTRRGYPGGWKTLIDDSVSGGLEAAPIVFDDQVIQTPLLHGELFPLVNIVPISRGRRIEGVITETVTGAWGGVDDTSITLFDTTAYVTEFNNTIYRWEGSIKIGLDFLTDTPIDFVQHITDQYGQRLLEDLDDVVAAGNGTTQPQGVINSGATAVTWGSSTTLGNYESLRFSVAKPEHGATVKSSAVFCGTETSYQRARAIPVGTTDARRLFGMDYDSYSIMQRPYKINESLTNAQVFYAILARYRMYRRRGFTLRTSTEGDTLIRDNSMLIAVTSRYGGRLERPATAGLVSDAPA